MGIILKLFKFWNCLNFYKCFIFVDNLFFSLEYLITGPAFRLSWLENNFGITGTALCWMESYLQGRYRQHSTNGSYRAAQDRPLLTNLSLYARVPLQPTPIREPLMFAFHASPDPASSSSAQRINSRWCLNITFVLMDLHWLPVCSDLQGFVKHLTSNFTSANC